MLPSRLFVNSLGGKPPGWEGGSRVQDIVKLIHNNKISQNEEKRSKHYFSDSGTNSHAVVKCAYLAKRCQAPSTGY